MILPKPLKLIRMMDSYSLGECYNNLAGNYNQACKDWVKASDLGYKNANKKANECSNAGNVKESINSLLSSQNY